MDRRHQKGLVNGLHRSDCLHLELLPNGSDTQESHSGARRPESLLLKPRMALSVPWVSIETNRATSTWLTSETEELNRATGDSAMNSVRPRPNIFSASETFRSYRLDSFQKRNPGLSHPWILKVRQAHARRASATRASICSGKSSLI